MFFLSFDNQLHFLILTLLPACLVFTAATWERTDSPKRIFGLLYISPLLLSVFAFLNSPVRREQADLLLYGAGLLMVLLAAGAEFAAKNALSAHVAEFVSLLLPVLYLSFAGLLPLALLKAVSPWLVGAATCLLALLLTAALATGRRADGIRLGGSLLSALGVLVFHMPLPMPFPLISHVLLATGLLLALVSLYRGTYANLQSLVNTHERKLQRIDENLQVEVTKRMASIEKSNRALMERARTDSLTGLYAKVALLHHAEMTMQRNPLGTISLIMLDIDHFKGINDKLGHPIGDRCLQSLASIARSSFRANDILARYGGDEFIFLLPGTAPKMALTVAERFRRNIEVGSNPKFTVSVGIATFPADGSDIKRLIDAADRALYQSKEQGRNRVTHISWQTDAAVPPT